MDFPRNITKGDSFYWEFSTSSYRPSNGWEMTAYFNGTSAQTVTATTSNDTFIVSLAPDDLTILPGRYQVAIVLSNTTERRTIALYQLVVAPDPAEQNTEFDPKSHAEKMLNALDALLERRATNYQLDIVKSTLKDRNVEKMSLKELLEVRDYYKRQVSLERGLIPTSVQNYFISRT